MGKEHLSSFRRFIIALDRWPLIHVLFSCYYNVVYTIAWMCIKIADPSVCIMASGSYGRGNFVAGSSDIDMIIIFRDIDHLMHAQKVFTVCHYIKSFSVLLNHMTYYIRDDIYLAMKIASLHMQFLEKYSKKAYGENDKERYLISNDNDACMHRFFYEMNVLFVWHICGQVHSSYRGMLSKACTVIRAVGLEEKFAGQHIDGIDCSQIMASIDGTMKYDLALERNQKVFFSYMSTILLFWLRYPWRYSPAGDSKQCALRVDYCEEQCQAVKKLADEMLSQYPEVEVFLRNVSDIFSSALLDVVYIANVRKLLIYIVVDPSIDVALMSALLNRVYQLGRENRGSMHECVRLHISSPGMLDVLINGCDATCFTTYHTLKYHGQSLLGKSIDAYLTQPQAYHVKKFAWFSFVQIITHFKNNLYQYGVVEDRQRQEKRGGTVPPVYDILFGRLPRMYFLLNNNHLMLDWREAMSLYAEQYTDKLADIYNCYLKHGMHRVAEQYTDQEVLSVAMRTAYASIHTYERDQ